MPSPSPTSSAFQKSHDDAYNLWSTHFGGIFMVFNFTNGSFQDKRLRTRRGARHRPQRRPSLGLLPAGRHARPALPPWPSLAPESRSLEYDPDKAKALLKQARAVGTPLKIICSANVPYSRDCGQVVQEQWTSVGFKATLEPLDSVPYQMTRRERAFDGIVQGNTLRFDPDDFYGRNLHSKSQYAQVLSGWQNERYDRLIEEAKRTLDPARRAVYRGLEHRER